MWANGCLNSRKNTKGSLMLVLIIDFEKVFASWFGDLNFLNYIGQFVLLRTIFRILETNSNKTFREERMFSFPWLNTCSYLREEYSKPCQTSRMEFFCENNELLSDVNYFCKRFHLRCLTGFCICLCLQCNIRRL